MRSTTRGLLVSKESGYHQKKVLKKSGNGW